MLQIDAKKIVGNLVMIRLTINDRDVPMAMALTDYEALKKEGFFLRPTDQPDSSGCINTTSFYYPKQ